MAKPKLLDFDEPILICCLNIYNILQPEVRNFEQELRNFYNSANSVREFATFFRGLAKGFFKIATVIRKIPNEFDT